MKIMKPLALKHQVRIERDDNHITILKKNTKVKSDTSRIWYDKKKMQITEDNAISEPNIPKKINYKKNKPNQLP